MSHEKNSYSIHALPVLTDNIIWIWIKGRQAVVIDPAITEPVKDWLESQNLNLTGILQTHHHFDHIGGTVGLLKAWPKAVVVAAKDDLSRIPFQTISVVGEDEFELMGYQIKVLDVAGHTSAHIAYYITPLKAECGPPFLFCGDTLFGAGCGRIFEGTAKKMYKALCLINQLPKDTKIYCAHEYTEENLRWAASIYPQDALIKKRLKDVINKRREGISSLPSTLSEERETNLFLRAKDNDEFTRLRSHKDRWNS